MARGATIAPLLALFLLAAGAAGQEWVNGSATHTGAPKGWDEGDVPLAFPNSIPDASCGYGPLSIAELPNFQVVGISGSNPLKKKPMGGCGTCLEVRCFGEVCDDTKAVLRVVVTDTCDRCGPTQLNLHAKSFMQLAPLSAGNMAVQWREAPCAAAGGIVVHVGDYRASEGGWLRIALKNVAGATLKSVEVAKAGTNTWRPMLNTFGANWELSKLPSLPLDIKATNTIGQSVVLPGVIATAGKTGNLPTTVQFKAP